MSFHILLNSTTADASDVNDNFYHVAQGSRLPMGGNSLAYTNGAYDLGSASYKWNNLYCNNINVTGNLANTWNKIYSDELASNTTRIEISGLDGDTDINYYLICRFKSPNTTCTYYLTFNGDSSATYGYYRIEGSASSAVYAYRANSQTGIYIGYNNAITTTSDTTFSNTWIYGKSGFKKPALTNMMISTSETHVGNIMMYAQVWNNTGTITSIQIYSSEASGIQIGSFIELWKTT